MFIVHNELEDGWMWVTNLRTNEQGLIVEDLVKEVVSQCVFVLFVLGYITYCIMKSLQILIACDVK